MKKLLLIAVLMLTCLAGASVIVINPFVFAAAGPPPEPPTEDTFYSDVAYLGHFDGTDASTEMLDYSNHTAAVTASANAQIDTDQKKFGAGSLLLDGTGDMIVIPNHAGLTFGTGDFAIEFWLRWNTNSGYHTIYDYGYVSGGSLTIQSGNGTRNLIVYINGYQALTESGSLTTGVWGFYQLIRVSGVVTLYRNGVSVASATNASHIENAADAAIGAQRSSGLYAFNGWIDDFRITRKRSRVVEVPAFAFPPSTQPTLRYVSNSYKSYNVGTATRPANLLNNDYLLFGHYDYYDSAVVTDWVEPEASIGSVGSFHTFWYKVAASEPDNITLPLYSDGILYAVRNVATYQDVVVHKWTSQTSTTVPGMTGAGDVFMTVSYDGNPNLFTPPDGWTLLYSTNLGGYNLRRIVIRKNNAGDGNSVTLTFPGSVSGFAIPVLIAP